MTRLSCAGQDQGLSLTPKPTQHSENRQENERNKKRYHEIYQKITAETEVGSKKQLRPMQTGIDRYPLQLALGATGKPLALGKSSNHRDADYCRTRLQRKVKYYRIHGQQVVRNRQRCRSSHHRAIDGDEKTILSLLLLQNRRESGNKLQSAVVGRQMDCHVLLSQFWVGRNFKPKPPLELGNAWMGTNEDTVDKGIGKALEYS